MSPPPAIVELLLSSMANLIVPELDRVMTEGWACAGSRTDSTTGLCHSCLNCEAPAIVPPPARIFFSVSRFFSCASMLLAAAVFFSCFFVTLYVPWRI
jgi:hypothetical protein